VGDRFAYFKGKVDKVKVDLLVIEGDRDPHLRGAEAKQLARITDPALQESSIARGGRPTRYLWVTQGYNLPCQLLAQAVHTMGTDLEFLNSCYLHALNHVRERGFQTVSFSLLGTKQMPTLNCSQGCPVSDLRLATRQDVGHHWKVVLHIHGPVNQKAVNLAIEDWKKGPEGGETQAVSLVVETGWVTLEEGIPQGPTRGPLNRLGSP
jgi:hypothetical protein